MVLLTLLAFAAGMAGCATGPKVSPFAREEWRSRAEIVGVVPARYTPEPSFDTFAKGRGTGAGKGAAGGAAIGAYGGLEASVRAGPVGILLLPFIVGGAAVIGGAVGTVAGTISAVPADRAQEVEAAIKNALRELNVQQTLGSYIVEYGRERTERRFELIEGLGPASVEEKPAFEALKAKGVDSAFEVRVEKVGFEGGKGDDPTITFVMAVKVSLFLLGNGEEIFSRTFRYESRPRKFSSWAEDGYRLVRDEFEGCYKDLAGRIVEEVFLVADFPMSRMSSYHFCMLKPVSPEYEYGFFKKAGVFASVDSLKPTLEWESFPRALDREDDKEEGLSRVSSVTYDLRIWKVKNDSVQEMVYERNALPQPSHLLEEPLEPATQYIWSVRARFLLDGHQRVTRWSYSRRPFNVVTSTCTLNVVPYPNSYRFITPK